MITLTFPLDVKIIITLIGIAGFGCILTANARKYSDTLYHLFNRSFLICCALLVIDLLWFHT